MLRQRWWWWWWGQRRVRSREIADSEESEVMAPRRECTHPQLCTVVGGVTGARADAAAAAESELELVRASCPSR